MEVDCLIQIEGCEPHRERLPVKSMRTAEREIKKMVDDFNAEEKRRFGEKTKTRKFVKILGKVKKEVRVWQKS